MSTKQCVSKYHLGDRNLPTSAFFKDSSRTDGLDKQCKDCRQIMKQRRVDRDPEAERRRIRERQMKRYHSDSDYRKSQKKLIYKRMPALAAKRRAQKLKATPPWFEENEVALLYAESAKLTQNTKVQHNVDHIVPLLNPKVCGLHCLENLQILTEVENKIKHNKFEI